MRASLLALVFHDDGLHDLRVDQMEGQHRFIAKARHRMVIAYQRRRSFFPTILRLALQPGAIRSATCFMERLKRREKYLIYLVSRLGLEPRALALKGLIRLLRLGDTESDGQTDSLRQD